MVGLFAVRQVEAEDVDAGADKAFEDGRLARRRADGGDDLGAAALQERAPGWWVFMAGGPEGGERGTDEL